MSIRGYFSEGEDKYVIDADACVDCGTCADACPTEAIVAGEIRDTLCKSHMVSLPSAAFRYIMALKMRLS